MLKPRIAPVVVIGVTALAALSGVIVGRETAPKPPSFAYIPPINWVHSPVRDQRWTKALLRRAGCPRFDYPYMIAIAGAESGYVSRATNFNYNNTEDVGIWQINTVWHGEGPIPLLHAISIDRGTQWLFDPENNAIAAVYVLRHQGLQAWSTFNSGAYRFYWPSSAVLS